MADQAKIRQHLDACRFLSLESFGPHQVGDSQFDLILEVAELKSQAPQAGNQTWDTETLASLDIQTSEDVLRLLENANRLVVSPDSAIFTIRFEDYASFQIMNETMTLPETDEDFSKKLRSYEKSRFLDYMATATCASDWLSEPLRHFRVICVNHIIDVACIEAPIISTKPARNFDA
ncbi:hypothetical protein [Rhizobium sp. WYJ-E13]|uniref:hypothetical protein n=1 Tax=Rhizobium sp. WYJ-E13 TaxID=2849093 RepID=UPI001C1F0601|nr:hypothetical protein [Rhizobium sp. WYJ-E13]QWW66844.1 hypothetical protein KQ933_14610 [Rhizobium sp. WYJ-E13]